MGKPVVHFEVVGRDGKKLQDFYGQLFDWQMNADNPFGYALVAAEEKGIGGGIGQTQDGSAGYVTFFVAVEDLQAALDKANQIGGRTIMPPTQVMPTVQIAMLADPEGHVIGLFKS